MPSLNDFSDFGGEIAIFMTSKRLHIWISKTISKENTVNANLKKLLFLYNFPALSLG